MAERFGNESVSPACTAEPSGYFDRTACRKGMDLLPGRYVQPRWRAERTVIGGHGPDTGWHLSDCSPTADACVLNGLVSSGHLRLMLNSVSPQCVGMATVGDIETVHGIAIRLRLPQTSCARGEDREAEAANQQVVVETMLHLSNAKATPTFVFGYSRPEARALWLLDNPDPIRADIRRRQAYNTLALAFAEAVGGETAPDPLLTDLPLPGVCVTRSLPNGRTAVAANTVLDLRPQRTRPSYGRRFEDLEALLDRIGAAPRLSAAA